MNGNKKRIGCGGVIGFFLLICVAVALFSRGDSTSSKSASSTPKPTKEASETVAPQTMETTKPTNTLKPAEKTTLEPVEVPALSIGDTATIGDLEFTVNEMTFSQYAGGLYGLNKTDSDYTYLVVYVDVNNPTNNTIELEHSILGLSSYTDYNIDMIFDGEVKYNHSFSKYTDFLFGNEEILPRATLTNKVLNFKVPVSVSNSTDSLELIISNNGKDETTWKLR